MLEKERSAEKDKQKSHYRKAGRNVE